MKVYLPRQRKASSHTIRTYRFSLDQLLDYAKEQNQVELADVTVEMLSRETITDFLDWVGTSQGCSVSTRNHKLKCIRAFWGYAAKMDSTTVIYRIKMRQVPMKKSTCLSLLNT